MKLIFGTEESQYLAESILKTNEANEEFIKGNVERQVFPDGERYLRILSKVQGRHCVVVGSTHNDASTLDIFDMSCALVKQGAKRLIVVIPYFGYSTMEREDPEKFGEVIKAKTRATLLSAIPKASYGNRFILLDLHADTITGFFENDVYATPVSSKKLIMKAAIAFAGHNFVIGSTDVGRAKQVEYLAREFEKDPENDVTPGYIYKRRKSGTETAVTGTNVDVKDRKVVIYDDMGRTCGSLMKAAEQYKEKGASEVYAIISHGVIPNSALTKVGEQGIIKQIAMSDSHPSAVAAAAKYGEFVKLYSVAGLLAKELK